MAGDLIKDSEPESSSQPEVPVLPPRPKSNMDWVADLVLVFGFICCAGVAVGWIEPPFSAGASAAGRVLVREASAATGGISIPADDPRFGTWSAPFAGNSKWLRTAKVSSAGVHGVRVSLTVDYLANGGTPVPGVLGEYYATALLQQDGKGQSSESGCQIQVEWSENGSTFLVRQKGPCGEASNLATDGMFTGSYRKQASPPPIAAAAPPPECAKPRTAEEKLFCKDPALRVAKEVTAAVMADAAAALRTANPELNAEFDQADKQWQAEIRRVCLAAESSPDDPDAGKSACFSQSYDARMNWLRLHTGLLHLASAAARDEALMDRYSDALGSYSDTYGALALQLPMFSKRLRGILPAKESEIVEVALTHRGPRSGLYQSGCGPLGCDQQEGAFEINPKTNSATVAVRQAGRITVYSFEGESAELPRRLREWLEQRTDRVREIVYKP